MEAEAEREDREHEHAGREPGTQASRASTPDETDRAEQEDGRAREQALLVGRLGASVRADASPDGVLARRGDQGPGRRREEEEDVGRAACFRMTSDNVEIRQGEEERSDGGGDSAREAGAEHPPRGSVVGSTPPPERCAERQDAEQVRERQTEVPAEADLPERDEPARDDHAGSPPAVTADEQRQRKSDSAAREHVQVVLLRKAKRRVRERCAREDGAGDTDTELAGEQVCADERKDVREEEQQSVADDGPVRASPGNACRSEACQRVGKRKRVAQWPERVGVEEVERVVEKGVAAPCERPRLQ